MRSSDRHDLLKWPAPVTPKDDAGPDAFEMQDIVARGVLKGGLWLAVILGSIGLLLIVGNYGVSKYVANSSEQPTLRGY